MSTSVDALKSQLQSARKALLFMETEHAKTLHGLHDEIKSLQKRCNELTFQIVVKEDEAYSNEVKTKIESLEIHATNSAHEKVLLIQQLEEKDRKILDLELKFKTQDITYTNEIKAKTNQVTTLASELDLRANTIAYLTTQLHQAHSKIQVMQKKKQEHKEAAKSSTSSSCDSTEKPGSSHRHNRLTPTPPTSSEGKRTSRRSAHRHSEKSVPLLRSERAQVVNGSLLCEGNRRPMSSSSDSPRDSFSTRSLTSIAHTKGIAFGNITPSIPDPSPFLERSSSKHSSIIKVKKQQEPIPPPSPPRLYSRTSNSRSVLPPISKQVSIDTTDTRSRTDNDDAKDSSDSHDVFVAPRRIKSTTSTYDVPISKVCTTPEHPSAVKRKVHKI